MAKIYRVIQIKLQHLVEKRSMWSLTYQKAYLSAITVTNISWSFTYKMAAKINWHRYGTKLRHSHPMYWHESVKPLQYYCSCLPVSILLPTKKLLFWKKMLCSCNMIWQSVVMPVSSLWQRNSTVNLTTLFALVLLVLSTASGFIFLN